MKLTDRVTVRLILDWSQLTDAKTAPQIYTAGIFLPPTIAQGYIGQNWAVGTATSKNLGAIIDIKLSSSWTLAAGAFRSVSDVPISYADLYLNTQPGGSADHAFVANPDQSVSSNSGEIRLTGQFDSGEFRHEVTLLARGRDTLAYYGGSAFVDLGPAQLGQSIAVPKPQFQFTDRTRDLTHLWSAGVGYRVQWQSHGDAEIGVQHESYEKTVYVPGLPTSKIGDRPLRGYARGAFILTDRLTAYAGYAQGSGGFWYKRQAVQKIAERYCPMRGLGRPMPGCS